MEQELQLLKEESLVKDKEIKLLIQHCSMITIEHEEEIKEKNNRLKNNEVELSNINDILVKTEFELAYIKDILKNINDNNNDKDFKELRTLLLDQIEENIYVKYLLTTKNEELDKIKNSLNFRTTYDLSSFSQEKPGFDTKTKNIVDTNQEIIDDQYYELVDSDNSGEYYDGETNPEDSTEYDKKINEMIILLKEKNDEIEKKSNIIYKLEKDLEQNKILLDTHTDLIENIKTFITDTQKSEGYVQLFNTTRVLDNLMLLYQTKLDKKKESFTPDIPVVEFTKTIKLESNIQNKNLIKLSGNRC